VKRLGDVATPEGLVVAPPYAFVGSASPTGALYRCNLPCDGPLEPLVNANAAPLAIAKNANHEDIVVFARATSNEAIEVRTCAAKGCQESPTDFMSMPRGVTNIAASGSFVASLADSTNAVFGCDLGVCTGSNQPRLVSTAAQVTLGHVAVASTSTGTFVAWTLREGEAGATISICPVATACSSAPMPVTVNGLVGLRAFGNHLYYMQKPSFGSGYAVARCELPDCTKSEELGRVKDEVPDALFTVDECGVVVSSHPTSSTPAQSNLWACYGACGDSPLPVASAQPTPREIAVDTNWIYWGNREDDAGALMRAPR
jgi:hypothetical protein